MELHSMVDVTGIKYKDNKCYKMDFRLIQHVKYEWKVDDKVIATIKSFHDNDDTISFQSDNFDNINWCIAIKPKRRNIQIVLKLLRWPFGISAINILHSISLELTSDKISGGDKNPARMKWIEWDPQKRETMFVFSGTINVEFPDICYDEFVKEEYIKIGVEIKILCIFDDDKFLIEKEEWKQYGFIC